ncbi:MAG: NAD(P)/FAD-dependent oxidoreductase [Emticicia sp.]|nr:NAD(P)/FAD-dependent oxidoreductase [Emticicia sp.]
MYDILVVGGGAAGFFAAINAAERNNGLKIAILERGRDVLQKVKVSGGGRCNVTHACFEPEKLVKFYPRGENELLAPFKRFNPTNTIEWFESRGVKIKNEADGRMFPVSDSSQSIIDCLLGAAQRNRIEILTSSRVEHFDYLPTEKSNWKLQVAGDRTLYAKKLMIATGSDTAVWNLLEKLKIKIIEPVPSLFTFNIKDERISDLMGLSVPKAKVKIVGTKFESEGPLLITHWGLSAPAILKLSAWAARELNEANYKFTIQVNWLSVSTLEEVKQHLYKQILEQPKKTVILNTELGIPIRLWKSLCKAAEIGEFQRWAETGKKHIQRLAEQLTMCKFEVNGKSTFKEEFVTAGGVDLSEIDFETYSLKQYPSLFMAGEVLNIDAITGGFNFQAAWTGGWIAAQNL